MIEAINVNKFYGEKQALIDFSLKVESGDIFALLGPNGAGKTSFVKAMLGITKLSSGTIKINGMDYLDENSRKSLCYLPEKFSFFPYYTVAGVVDFYAKMQGVSGKEIIMRRNDALSKMNILDLAKKKVSTLSKGQLQRVGISNLLVGESKLLVLDEPFSGLDPIGIKDLKDVLVELKNSGRTIFINSHILSEMEVLCDHFAIIGKGQCLHYGRVGDLSDGENLEDFFYKTIKGENL